MELAEAKLLIRSLVGRLERRETFFEIPSGRLSCYEVEALTSLAEVNPRPLPTDARPENEAVLPPEPIRGANIPKRLIRDAFSRKGPPEKTLRICLDFGTAMSKAWATGRTVGETLPLILGEDAGGSPALAVPSSIFINDRGGIYIGLEAERQHREHIGKDRRRFDNIKRLLSEVPVDSDLYALPLDREIDPTESGLSRGDLLVLYLAWLTDLSLTALDGAIRVSGSDIGGESDLRSVVRRYAIPCFEDADSDLRGKQRAAWAKSVMADILLRSQVLADTLAGNWDQLTTRTLRILMDELHDMDVRGLSSLLAQRADIREPVAAGASRFDSEIAAASYYPRGLRRRLLLVVDAGAGTTDFAMFQVINRNDEHDDPRYALLRRSVRMSRIAGNQIDEILRPLILEKCGIDPKSGAPRSVDDFDHIRRDLDSQIRNIKQRLFVSGSVDIVLNPNAIGRLDLTNLEDSEAFQSCFQELTRIRDGIVGSLFSKPHLDDIKAANLATSQPYPIAVLLTGGSAVLPCIQNLAVGDLNLGGTHFRFTLVDRMPDWIDRLPRETAERVGAIYPQSAVAIGGSASELPVEIDDMENPITPPAPGRRILPTTQITGV